MKYGQKMQGINTPDYEITIRLKAKVEELDISPEELDLLLALFQAYCRDMDNTALLQALNHSACNHSNKQAVCK